MIQDSRTSVRRCVGYLRRMPRRRFPSDIELTEEDTRALEFVQAFWQAVGHSPTIREVAAGCGWKSAATAERHIKSLVAAGKLKRDRAGALVFPGLVTSTPSLAPLLTDDDPEAGPTQWVVAPASGLLAWRGGAGDTFFVDPSGPPGQGQSVLAWRHGEGYFVARFQGQLQARERPKRDNVLGLSSQPTGVEVVGVIRYQLTDLRAAGDGDEED